jgi:hypothetical protein
MKEEVTDSEIDKLITELFSKKPQDNNVYKCKVIGVTSDFGMWIQVIVSVEIDLGFGVKITKLCVLENIISNTANSKTALDWLQENVYGKDNVYLCCKNTDSQYPQVHLFFKPDRSEVYESINELLT